jgi:hypothetical protein
MSVIEMTLVLIGENFVGLADFFEFSIRSFSLIFGDFVWVVL